MAVLEIEPHTIDLKASPPLDTPRRPVANSSTASTIIVLLQLCEQTPPHNNCYSFTDLARMEA